VKGEKIPQVVHANISPTLEEIPLIKHPSLTDVWRYHEAVPKLPVLHTHNAAKKKHSIDKIMQEVAVNVKEGNGKITLATEDIFLYGAKDNGFIPNKKAV
jgi:hypothetical protein